MKLIASVVALTLLSGAAMAQTRDSAPAGAAPAKEITVTAYYKQDVYDPSDNKIGTVDDVLIDSKSGTITSLVIGVGGFLGVGEKDIATKFQNVQMKMKNDKWYLVMNADKDALKKAPGLKYDRTSMTWVPDRKT
jgi:sporulation protein YlmC with PRC-barrel domain